MDGEAGLDELDPATSPARDAASFRRIVEARGALESAERELRDAVQAARKAGDSWSTISAALDISPQAARERFASD